MTDDLIERLRAEDLEAAENVIRAWALLGGGDEGQWPRYIALGIDSIASPLRTRIAVLEGALERLGGSEAFTSPFMVQEGPTGDELKARIQFARDTRATLNGEKKHG